MVGSSLYYILPSGSIVHRRRPPSYSDMYTKEAFITSTAKCQPMCSMEKEALFHGVFSPVRWEHPKGELALSSRQLFRNCSMDGQDRTVQAGVKGWPIKLRIKNWKCNDKKCSFEGMDWPNLINAEWLAMTTNLPLPGLHGERLCMLRPPPAAGDIAG